MIGIIGVGNMGSAIAKKSKKRLIVSDVDPNKLQFIKDKHISIAKDNIGLAKQSNIIILAVKPHDVIEVLKEIMPYVKDKLIISIAAGIETGFIERILQDARIIRVMPNMGILAGKGISAITLGKSALSKDLAHARRIFSKTGEVVEVKESLMDIVTALSGSGPAYYFLLTDILERIGSSYGLKKDIARRLAVGTFIGSAKCAEAMDISMQGFIKKVASKGGTTEAALKVFKKKGLERIVQTAVRSAVNRGRSIT